MAKIQKKHIIDLPVYLSKLRSIWLNVIFYSKGIKGLQHNHVCSEEKPQLERQLAHAQTFDRGVLPYGYLHLEHRGKRPRMCKTYKNGKRIFYCDWFTKRSRQKREKILKFTVPQ